VLLAFVLQTRFMPILYSLGPGTIVRCDYSRGGFQPPEMVKPRPAIVISPRLPYREGLCTVVPISGSHSGKELDYVVRLEFDPPLPDPFNYRVAWAKCDMIATVGFQRLDMFRTARDQSGKRKYLKPKLNEQDYRRVQLGVLYALGCASLMT
jgi:mRNA interferase MazF